MELLSDSNVEIAAANTSIGTADVVSVSEEFVLDLRCDLSTCCWSRV